MVGVHNIQVMRANREHPAPDNGNGWTYNHQSMLAYWNGQFYMHYLSDPSDEHIPPSQTFLMTSKDGYHWTNPVTLFPTERALSFYRDARAVTQNGFFILCGLFVKQFRAYQRGYSRQDVSFKVFPDIF